MKNKAGRAVLKLMGDGPIMLRGYAKTELEKKAKIAIAELIASSPYIGRRKKQFMINDLGRR